MFPSRIGPKEFGTRRTKLLKNVYNSLRGNEKKALVILKGTKKQFIAPDVPFPFRQCSHFRYVSGISSPDLYYIIQFGGKTEPVDDGSYKKILVSDKRSEHEELWEGKLPSIDGWEKTGGLSDVIESRAMFQTLEKLCDSETAVFFEETSDRILSSFLKSKAASFKSLNSFVDQLRVVKSADELESMRDVCSIGAQTMSATIAGSKFQNNENSIVGLLEFEGRRRGSEMQAYPPVVAAGDRANTIHYLEANQSISLGDCILMDAGCDLNGYVSDITRSFPISGQFSDHQRTLYEALLYTHEQLLEYAAGLGKIKLNLLYSRMMELLAANMVEIGLIQETDNQAILAKAEELCPHHVSHYLGMDVHDCATVRRDIELTTGVIFTIEPGVYVPKSWPVKEFRGIGFRIEDDVAVAENGGIEVLTSLVPRSSQDIEELME